VYHDRGAPGRQAHILLCVSCSLKLHMLTCMGSRRMGFCGTSGHAQPFACWLASWFVLRQLVAGRSHCWAGASAPQIVLEGCNIRSCSTCPLAVVRLVVHVMCGAGRCVLACKATCLAAPWGLGSCFNWAGQSPRTAGLQPKW